MTPERLKAFVVRKMPGTVSLQLEHDRALGKPEVIASWSRAEVDGFAKGAATAPDIVADILENAQTFADGEGAPTKFLIRWFGEKERVLGSTAHRAAPRRDSTEASPGEIIRDLLKMNLEQGKTLISGIAALQTAHKETLALLVEQLRAANAHPALEAQVVISDEEREEVMARAKALDALTSKLPDLLDVLYVGAERFLSKGAMHQ